MTNEKKSNGVPNNNFPQQQNNLHTPEFKNLMNNSIKKSMKESQDRLSESNFTKKLVNDKINNPAKILEK